MKNGVGILVLVISLLLGLNNLKAQTNTISTVQPVITMSSDSVCIGSHILVPFWSTGVLKENNEYIAELSDSAGNFPSNPNIIGTSIDANTYDPALVPSPGNLSGIISESKTNPVPNGCHYYIRVVSTDPATVGSVWGPFCIKHCDIETNHTNNIQVCIHSCAVGPYGFNTLVYVKIHDYDSTAIYKPNNQFKVELLDTESFSVVSVGTIGKITATNDTTLNLHIPCADSLTNLGLKPSMYYMRIVATNSNHPYNTNGTIILLTIGAPADNLTIYQYPSDSVFCVGDAVYFYPIPYNGGPPMNSTYEWYVNDKIFSTQPSIGILFEASGTFSVEVQETNNGCKGPLVPVIPDITVLGPPNDNITGPNDICTGETIQYSDSLQKNVEYEWEPSGGKIIDTSKNIINIRFDSAGAYTLEILAVNKCGSATGKKNILVIFRHQTPIITFKGYYLESSAKNNNQWYTQNRPIYGATDSILIPTSNGYYYDIVTNLFGCNSDTSNIIQITNAGIEQLTVYNEQLTIYPNPANDIVTIDFKGDIGKDKANLEIYNVIGGLLKTLVINGALTQMNISDLAEGVYIFKVMNDKGVCVRKVIKE